MDVILYFRPSPASHPEKLAGIREIAEKSRIHIQVIDEVPTKERMLALQTFWKCSGVIVECGGRETPVNPRIFGATPVVFFNHSFETLSKRCFAIGHDSRATGLLAARELLLNGFSSFAYVSEPSNPFWSQERRQGFVEALSLNGKQCHEFTWPGATSDTTERTKHLKVFLQSLPKPCAIFAANDKMASEIITAARLSNIGIPDDVVVLGVDNSPDICEHTNPTLSSIEPDFRRGGNLTMLMLQAIMRDGNAFRGSRHRTFGDLRVVRRLSTKRLQRKDPIVSQALDLIRQMACQGLTAADVVRLFPCSRRMADLRFTQTVGRTILDEIHSVRLERAKQLLHNTNQALEAISDFCGFKNPNSLRKFFLKETGMTLSVWRKRHQRRPECEELPEI